MARDRLAHKLSTHSPSSRSGTGTPAHRHRRRSPAAARSEEHTSELQSRENLVCRLLLVPTPTVIYTLSLHDALPIYCTNTRIALMTHAHDQRTCRSRI